MKITMDGEYAFEDDPAKKIQVIYVDAPGRWPVIGLFPDGRPFSRDEYGMHPSGCRLIPLQRKPREFWLNAYSNGHVYAHKNIHAAKLTAGTYPAETIHVREVLE